MTSQKEALQPGSLAVLPGPPLRLTPERREDDTACYQSHEADAFRGDYLRLHDIYPSPGGQRSMSDAGSSFLFQRRAYVAPYVAACGSLGGRRFLRGNGGHTRCYSKTHGGGSYSVIYLA